MIWNHLASRDDQGVSSLLGFIVGFAVLTGSMAAVVYYTSSAPESGTTETSRNLESTALRTIETLTTTPGQPTDWNNTGDLWANPPDQTGLLREGTDAASIDKINKLQSGALNTTILLKSFDLLEENMSMDVKGSVVPVPEAQPPGMATYAIADGYHASMENEYDEITLTTTTKNALDRLATVNPSFNWTTNTWVWEPSTHPEVGMGNTFIDTPWSLETQMIPRMAGIHGTSTVNGTPTTSQYDNRALDMAKTFNLGDEDVTRWHVIKKGDPRGIPGCNSVESGSYVFGLAFPRETGSDSGCGQGLWRTVDGMDARAVIGGFEIADADSAELSFAHLLNIDDDEATECYETIDNGDPLDDNTNCVEVDARIKFWNGTASPAQWDTLDLETDACTPSNPWNDTTPGEGTSGKWQNRTVGLCQALAYADGDLWLTFEWETKCRGLTGSLTSCDEKSPRGWFLDNINVTTTTGGSTTTVFSTTFDPRDEDDGRELLFASEGVHHGLLEGGLDKGYFADASKIDPAAGSVQRNVVNPITDFVQAGGHVVSFAPGGQGKLLGEIGLQGVSRNTTRNVDTPDADKILMRMPYLLPRQDESYDAHDYVWSMSDPPGMLNITAPAGFTPLDVVQNTTEVNPGATLIRGTPYADGGKVSALAFNLTTFNDTDLRNKTVENLYTSTVFKDPTFDAAGSSVPQSGTVPLHATKRVMLAEVTDDRQYQIPLEVTLYLWDEAVGSS